MMLTSQIPSKSLSGLSACVINLCLFDNVTLAPILNSLSHSRHRVSHAQVFSFNLCMIFWRIVCQASLGEPEGTGASGSPKLASLGQPEVSQRLARFGQKPT